MWAPLAAGGWRRDGWQADTRTAMRDLLPALDDWSATDPRLGLATVVRTSGSTPRPAGARLLVAPDGRMAGSVSGGCLEAAVVGEAQSTLNGEAAARVVHYGISDELGWEVGLACGGSVDILIETVDRDDAVLGALREAIAADRAVALVSVLDGPNAGARALVDDDAQLVGSLGDATADVELGTAVAARLASGLPGVEEVAGIPVFVEPITPPPILAVIGAVHIAMALTTMARAAGYRVVIVDPRTAFNSEERLPDADRRIVRWPEDALPDLELGPRDAAVCLAHDPKFEDPALTLLLRSEVGYVGAIGSRTTHAKRVARLHEAGFDDAAIARIHSPVGLDLGAATPAEIALAILAEVVAHRRGRGGGTLSAKPAA